MKSRKTIEQDLQEILVAYKIGRITLEEAVRVIIFEINKVREETIIWTLNNIKAFENEWKEYKGSKTKGEYLIQRYKELNKLKK